MKTLMFLAMLSSIASAKDYPFYYSSNVALTSPADSCTGFSGTSPKVAKCSVSSYEDPTYFSGTTSGTAGYGEMSLTTSGSVNEIALDLNPQPFQQAGNDEFLDYLTLSNAPENGMLLITFSYTQSTKVLCQSASDSFVCAGSLLASLQNGSGIVASWTGNASQFSESIQPVGTSESGKITVLQPYTGAVVPLWLSLNNSASCTITNLGQCTWTSSIKLKVVSIKVEGAPGATMTSGSGTNYN